MIFSRRNHGFQSTSSVWRTTVYNARTDKIIMISIHVLRVEDDGCFPAYQTLWERFQSTSSVWRTTTYTLTNSLANVFQSTSSVWRTTADRYEMGIIREISIHVLRVEDDDSGALNSAKGKKFQSTSSVWRTTCSGITVWHPEEISIHVLRVEDDQALMGHATQRMISIHVLRVEDDGMHKDMSGPL